ncbi:Acetamidase/Formamidase family-domain-containing protein [Podospora fimiseda]|uniref:Acetamidase/Formamidase family-domain-containing protein n=1 Tax=Podospora fimiseda TaxID=252190 RepID=A0AAN7BRF2_9PEZI|nr:Acetamidase/Formamidase family-domain-containing protein [Podospora fimiseda]
MSQSKIKKPHIDKDKLKQKLDVSHFDLNAVLRGAQLTLVGAQRALRNPDIFTSRHYKQAAIAVAAGILIRIIIAIPIIGIKSLLWTSSFFFSMDRVSWDDKLVGGLGFIEEHVLQAPLFFMSLMRYVTPTLDDLFMDSLRWVDVTYVQKHKHDEDPSRLRAMYYPQLKQYPKSDGSTGSTSMAENVSLFLMRFARRGGISLAIFFASYLPYVGRFVLPAASFYTFNKAVGLGPAAIIFGTGVLLPRRYLVIFLQSYFASRSLMRELLEPYFARVKFTKEEKKKWFRNREGLLFGFGIGFYTLLKVPLVGVLIYGIAEASTAYLITKISDPPPPAAERQGFAASQVEWKNKQKILSFTLRCHIKISIKFLPDTKIDLNKPAADQPYLHNRWHPDIPSAATIKNGETVKIECLDWTGGQIKNDDSADDIRNVDLTKVHYLSGPFEIEGAEPGDALLVEIMDVQPFEDQPWGFTGIFDRRNGGGFLDEMYPSAAKAIWDFEGISCTSRHIPHVKFAGLIHPGILGCAPSQEILEVWNKREAELIAANKLDREVALPPQPKNVHAGSTSSTSLIQKIGNEGARTIPGRPEHGGNCDIKNLSRGSKVYLPIHVPGAKFSVGDLHFSQGDGEISFCGAIEMAGIITLNFKVIKNGIEGLALKSPMFVPGNVEPQFGLGRMLYFEGFSVDEGGRQHYMDVTVAYRQTCLRVIEYLRRFGYDDYQIYLLLSCAPIQGHVAGIVDIPNACTTIGLPMDIFGFDVSPEAEVKRMDMGRCAFESGREMGEVREGGGGGKKGVVSFGGGLSYKE